MTSLSVSKPMTPKDRARYGAAVVKDAAFDAVHALWRRRRDEHWTQKQAADSIGADEGWYSKQFNGPRNWTMETFGALVESLNGQVEIIIHALEDSALRQTGNYDAYAEMDDLPKRPSKAPKKWSQPQKDHSKTEGIKKIEFSPAS